MTMPVNQRFRPLALELQFPPAGLFFLNDEFFKQERRPGYICHMVTLHEVRVFISESENAARLAAHDRVAVLHESMELPDIEIRILSRGFRESLRNHRPAAAPPL